jgi:RHS repeat-associated protein
MSLLNFPRTIMNSSWTTITTSAYDWMIGFQGLMHDEETELVYNRTRYLSTGLGRHLSRDHLGYSDGGSLHEYVASRPISLLDPLGEKGIPSSCCMPRSDGECCREAVRQSLQYNEKGDPVWGITICCDGRKVACDVSWANPPFGGFQPNAESIIAKCTTEHECTHFDDVSCWHAGGCGSIPKKPHFTNQSRDNYFWQECGEYRHLSVHDKTIAKQRM